MSKSKTCSFVPTNLALQCYCNFRKIWQIYANLWQQQNESEQIANGHVHITKNGQVLRCFKTQKASIMIGPIVQAWKKAKIPWRLPGHSTVIMPIIPTLCKRLTVIPKDIPVVAITLTTPVQLAIILLHWKTHTNTNFQITTWKKTTYSQIHMYIWIKNTLRVTCICKYSVHNFHYNIYIYIQYVCIMLLLCLKLLRELYDLWNSSWILTQTTEALAVTWLVSR